MKYKVDLPKLADCIEQDYRALEPYRENLYAAQSEAVGSHYSDSPNSTPHNETNPVNLISLSERVILAHLVGSDPRMMVSTEDRSLRHFVRPFEGWGNRQLRRMKFGDVIRRWVKDAYYSLGIVKCSITAPTEARFGEEGHKLSGEIGLGNIDLEDWVWDMRAKRPEECWYMGHRYIARVDQVRSSKLFSARARKQVQAQDEQMLNPGGDARISQIGRGTALNHHSYYEYCELYEIWIRDQNLIVTFDADGPMDEPLLVQKWVGPGCGPYHFLSFGDVTGNLMPKAPVMDLIDTHRSYNLLWRKLDNQASEAKRVCVYQDEEVGEKFKKEPDGGYVQANHPKEVGEVTVKSGPDVPTANWAMQAKDMNFMLGGNTEVVGGLGSQADTLGQEKLVAESASKLVNSMGQRVLQGSNSILRASGWFAWKNPRIVMESRWSPTGAPESVNQVRTPMDRFQQPFEEINLEIDAYSYVAQTPQSKLRLLDSVVKEFIIPLLPMFGQPGVGDMLAEHVKITARLANCPELLELLEKLTGIEAPVEQAVQGEEPMPAETTRTYERVSRSGGMSDQAQGQVMAQLMAGGEPGQGSMGSGIGQMTQGAV